MLKIWAPLGLFYRWKSGFREVKSTAGTVVSGFKPDVITLKACTIPTGPSLLKVWRRQQPGSHQELVQNAGDPALPSHCRTRICTLTSPPAVLCTGQVWEARSETTLLWKCGTVSFFSSGVTRDTLGSVKLRVSFVSELELQHSALPAPFPAASEWRQWTKAEKQESGALSLQRLWWCPWGPSDLRCHLWLHPNQVGTSVLALSASQKGHSAFKSKKKKPETTTDESIILLRVVCGSFAPAWGSSGCGCFVRAYGGLHSW